jgi:endonuclease YncB( thermonuclease family)
MLLAGADINLQQVRDGYAWVYEKYIGENTLDVQARYRSAEAEARADRRGSGAIVIRFRRGSSDIQVER